MSRFRLSRLLATGSLYNTSARAAGTKRLSGLVSLVMPSSRPLKMPRLSPRVGRLPIALLIRTPYTPRTALSDLDRNARIAMPS